MMNREHFRGVIWPRGEQENGGKKVYRYVIVGMLVTDEPIENVGIIEDEGKVSQYFINQNAFGMSDLIRGLFPEQTNAPLGTADDILTSLDTLPDEVEACKKIKPFKTTSQKK